MSDFTPQEILATEVIVKSERFEDLLEVLIAAGDFRQASTHDAGPHWIVPMRESVWDAPSIPPDPIRGGDQYRAETATRPATDDDLRERGWVRVEDARALRSEMDTLMHEWHEYASVGGRESEPRFEGCYGMADYVVKHLSAFQGIGPLEGGE